MMRTRKAVLITTVCVMALCMSACSSNETDAAPVTETPSAEPAESTEPQLAETPSEEEQIDIIYKNALDSTVCIFTPTGNNGTGFLYNEHYVITNAHVLYEAEDFTLQDSKNNEYKGTVVFQDEANDIAVIRADDFPGTSVVFGNSDEVQTGDMLVLIGNPADGKPFSFCTGKKVDPEEDFLKSIETYIPTDAPIVSGYSGGPVFNLAGELIGISNAAYTGDLSEYDFDHLSLLIPINRVKAEIEENCVN